VRDVEIRISALEWALIYVVTSACLADRWKLLLIKRKKNAAFLKEAQAK